MPPSHELFSSDLPSCQSHAPSPPWDSRLAPPAALTSRSRGRPPSAFVLHVGDDPRSNPNCKYYEPECDPHSRFYTGPIAPPPASSSLRSAYGTARPLRSAPSPRGGSVSPRTARHPHLRHGKCGNPRAAPRPPPLPNPPATVVPYTSTEMVAASTLSKNKSTPDIGSLYYVLGTQGSSRRVKQLQHLISLQQTCEAAGMPEASLG